MAVNIYHRCDTSDFSSIVADILATASRSMTIWMRGMARAARIPRTGIQPESETALVAEDQPEVGGNPDDDASFNEAWCLAVAAGEIIVSYLPAPADPDDDLEDEDESEDLASLRLEEAA